MIEKIKTGWIEQSLRQKVAIVFLVGVWLLILCIMPWPVVKFFAAVGALIAVIGAIVYAAMVVMGYPD